ncbi:hypothetical protein ALC56_09226 [Trachymyrmex septentrionalis]|uniref:CHK kinase-like domain-containing protein n=1 Tax=Trachymyrmex septentrionalis TaxID=34720 RepID=A0A195F7A4_9HYME|nr:PREDICTED: uncharacterized protein LOC108750990 [Trachymyrmex septentrionalis]KYN36266.1 hypothetical protein ALC56_09226 [Trachymyrmex septentrionalis]
MSLNKKCVTLSEMNNQFTEDVLINILSKICNGNEVQLTDWSFNEGSAKGDNYLSNIYKGKVNGIINGDPKQHVQANIVVKSMPKNPGTRKTLRCVDFFHNEIAFYTQIISKFENFLAEKGQTDLLCIPRHLISSTDNDNGFLILEDASCLGFRVVSRQNCLDWAESLAVLKTLSKFHAISFAYKDQKKEEFAEMTNSLKETFFSHEHWDWYKGFHEKIQVLIKHALATEYPNSKAEKQYNSYKFGALFNKCTELCNRRDAPTSIVVEGDCWGPNFLIRDIGRNQKQALMLDFQLARCASPVIDLSFLIYACTLKSFRDQYFDEILKTYHSELSNAIRLLGSDPEKLYPWDLFMKEVKEQFVFGVFASLDAILLCLIDLSESFTIDTAIEGDEAIDISDGISFSDLTTIGRQRLADVIVHAVEKGYI